MFKLNSILLIISLAFNKLNPTFIIYPYHFFLIHFVAIRLSPPDSLTCKVNNFSIDTIY